MNRIRFPATLLALLGSFAPLEAQSGGAALVILRGVSEIGVPGTPSPLACWSPHAEVILEGRLGKEQPVPAVVAGEAGHGRFVALPHDGCFDASFLGVADSARFLANAVRWAAHDRERPRVAAGSVDSCAPSCGSGAGSSPVSTTISRPAG